MFSFQYNVWTNVEIARRWLISWSLPLLCRRYILLFLFSLANLGRATKRLTTDSNFLFNYLHSFGRRGSHMKPSLWRPAIKSSSSREKLKFQLGSLPNDQSDENTNNKWTLKFFFLNRTVSFRATNARCRYLMVMMWISYVKKRKLEERERALGEKKASFAICTLRILFQFELLRWLWESFRRCQMTQWNRNNVKCVVAWALYIPPTPSSFWPCIQQTHK